MIDIHCHILPGVDDGAKNIEEAVDMAKIAMENGIETIFATPHYIEDVDYSIAKENRGVLSNLNNILAERGINVQVLLGNEAFISPDILEFLDRGNICTLNGSRYLLMELPMMEIPMYAEDIIFALRLKGIIPIIAHPERYKTIIEDPNILFGLIQKGALAQLNLPSLAGLYGKAVADTARILLNHDMIHFLGTDAHSSKGMSRNTKVLEDINKILDEDRVERILYTNPKAIINNKDINILEPKKYIRKRGIHRFIKKLWMKSIN